MPWPALSLEAWKPTRDTLHRYAQIVGKIQLALTPVVNHYWNVALHVTARGLATSALRYERGTFDIELDLVGHQVVVRTSEGPIRTLELRPRAVADFQRELFDMLESLGIRVRIWDHPVEIANETTPFSQDREHAAYDRDYANRFFQVLAGVAPILEDFRARFAGKCNGVGFFWGTFDLCSARYSGLRAPDPVGGSAIERESYSHEVSEVGFWPGDVVYQAPAFYALHYPAPAGYAESTVAPADASWFASSRCFVLPYMAIRDGDVAAKVLEFCQSTYEAGARLAMWNRTELERPGKAP